MKKISNKQAAKADLKDIVLNHILSALDSGSTPVSKEKWPKLSKEYSKKTGKRVSDMELSGDMLSSLQAKNTKDGIIVGFFKKTEAEKADGHCKFSGRPNNLPQRRFLPDTDQKFKQAIMKDMEAIIKEYIDGGT